jgi:hypothetical protein
VSISIAIVALLFVGIIVFGEQAKAAYSTGFGILGIFVIYFIVTQL